MIEGPLDAEASELARLFVDPFGPIEGLITWQANRRFGFLFACQIDVARIHTADPELKSAFAWEDRIRTVESQKPPSEPLVVGTNSSDSALSRHPAAAISNGHEGDAAGASITRCLLLQMETLEPSAQPSRRRRNGRLAGAVALASAGMVGALLLGTFGHSPSPTAVIPQRAAKIAERPVQHQPSEASVSSIHRTSPAQSPPRARYQRQEASGEQTPRLSERIGVVIPRPIRLRPDASMPSMELTTGPGATPFDPYAGRVAKRLSGESLKSAIAADRRATKELNIRQLHQIQIDTVAQSTGSGVQPSLEQ